MGFLKKIFKPVSKVLDKVIPNELKPALPYLAAFAPMIAPGIMGTGMAQRALMGGGLNIFGQLSQEGNEGDINLLSAGLGALTGAMTGPGAADKFQAMKTPTGNFKDVLTDTVIKRPELTGLQKATNFGLEGLSKGSEMFAAGMADPFSMAGLKAAALPAATATGDLMFAQAKRDQDEYDDMMAAESEADAASDAQRAFAIRRAMEATGATEEEIEDAIYAAGYKTGGRVGFEIGGLSSLLGAAGKGKEESKYITKKSDTSETDTINRIYEEQGGDGLSAYLERNPDLKDKYVIVESYGGELTIMKNKLHPDFMDIENIIMLKGDEKKAKGGRVGLRFGGIGDAVENIEDAEMKESVKFAMQDMDIPIMDLVEEFEIQFKRKPNSIEELKQFYKDRYEYKGPGDVKMKEEIKEKVVMEAKDGGRIGFDEGGDEGDGMLKEIAKIIFRLTPAGAGIMAADEAIEMYNNLSEEDKEKVQSFGKKAMRFAGIPGLAVSAGMELSEKFKEKEMKDGGLMNLGGKEMDMRGGGFIPIGKKERADDVPARLSKNEFVMTADAVRAAGGGSVNKGAKRMYDVMNKLEARA